MDIQHLTLNLEAYSYLTLKIPSFFSAAQKYIMVITQLHVKPRTARNARSTCKSIPMSALQARQWRHTWLVTRDVTGFSALLETLITRLITRMFMGTDIKYYWIRGRLSINTMKRVEIHFFITNLSFVAIFPALRTSWQLESILANFQNS